VQQKTLVRSYFSEVQSVTIFFASPFVRPKVQQQIYTSFDKLKEDISAIIYQECPEKTINLEIIINEKFKNDIVVPTIIASKEVADLSDLFIRSIKLLALTDKSLNTDFGEVADPTSVRDIHVKTEDEENEEIAESNNIIDTETERERIGQYVRRQISRLIENRKLANVDAENFLDREKSKRNFNLSFPLFAVDRDENPERYYAEPFRIGDAAYFLTNDWYERNRAKFDDWLFEIDNKTA